MPSLFDPTGRAEVLTRLDLLAADRAPLWGKMTPAQACAHCAVGLRLALGEATMKRPWFAPLVGPLMRRLILSPKPFARNAPTAPLFRVTDPRELEAERRTLAALVRRFGEGGPGGVRKDPHPLFGPLAPAEWDLMQWKHLDHHLRQYGV